MAIERANEIASTVFRDIFISEEAEGALKTNLSHNTLAASTIGATMGNIVGIVVHNTIIGSSDSSVNDRGF